MTEQPVFAFAAIGAAVSFMILRAGASAGMGQRLVTLLGCLAAAVLAALAYHERNFALAGLAAAGAFLCGADYLGLARRFALWLLALASGVRSGMLAAWPAVWHRVVTAIVAFAAGLALFMVAHFTVPIVHGPRPDQRIAILGAGALGIGLMLFGVWRFLGAVRRFLGGFVPPRRSGYDLVAGQMIHGRAGFADAGGIDAALRDQDQAAALPPRFRE